jgi:lipoprotein-anchoring transpeptidase ErfK/SrfK
MMGPRFGIRIAAMASAMAAVQLSPPPAVASAPAPGPAAMPAVAVVAGEFAPVRSAPRGDARRLQLLRPLRPDGRKQVLLAVAEHRDERGRLWYRVRIQHRPNGTSGWVLAKRLTLRAVRTRIVVRRRARTLTVRRAGKVLMSVPVAVGARKTPTPLGTYFVTARFRPEIDYLGAYAFETSAFSRLSDWPGGGIVGIHGTDQPQLLGRAVSHGCIRVSDRAVLRLRQLIPLGAPISIRR